jgi:hypothetical protein
MEAKAEGCCLYLRDEVSDRQVGWLQLVTCNDGLHCIVWELMAWCIRVLMSVTKCTASKENQFTFTIHKSTSHSTFHK